MKERSRLVQYVAQHLFEETTGILIAETLNARKHMMRKGLENLAETRNWKQPKKRANNKTAVGSSLKFYLYEIQPHAGLSLGCFISAGYWFSP